MKRLPFMALALSGALLLLLATQPLREPAAPPSTRAPVSMLFFSETGHPVHGLFLDYFERSGGQAVHGLPITDMVIDPYSGRKIQYFERSRFEWYPENAEADQVQLGRLGTELGPALAPLPLDQAAPAGHPRCQYIAESGHQICDAFLEYWRAPGGAERLGLPISEYWLEDGQLVQWFERARLEWHPERSQGERIQVAALGHQAFIASGLPLAWLEPNAPLAASLGETLALRVRASVQQAVTAPGIEQRLFVYVADQLGDSLQGATVVAIVHFAGTTQPHLLKPTDAAGIAELELSLPAQPAGTLVTVEVLVEYQRLLQKTVTSFRTWY